MKSFHNTNFPAPKYLAMSSCALDISDKSIKYGQIVRTAHGFRLGFHGNESIPEGIVVSGKIEDAPKLAEVLKKIRIKEEISFVRVSLPEEQMYLFNILIPNIAGSDLREAILLQLEEHIPLSATEAVFDFDVIKETDSNIFVQVAAAQASLIESYLSVFEQAGLVPLSFELEGQAMARAITREGDTSTIMVIDFGQTRTGISISSAGKVLFSSTFDMGGRELTELVAKNFDVSYDEAEKMKKSYGKSDDANDIFPVIVNTLSVLRDEINKHYVYWQNHEGEDGNPHPKIEKIVLCGGDSNLVGIVAYLETSMKIPVEYANTWVNVLDVSSSVPDMQFYKSLSYVTVIGLSLGDF